MYLLLLSCRANVSCAPKMGGDKAIGCHSHPQGNQELKISSITNFLIHPEGRTRPLDANLTTTKSPRSNYGFHFSILRRIFLHLEKKHCERHPSSAACWKPNLTMMALKTMMEVLKIMMIMVMKVWMLQR